LNGRGVLPTPTIDLSFVGPFVAPQTQVAGTVAPQFAVTTITNIGGQPLSLSFAFTGANPADFQIGRGGGVFGNCSQNIILPTISQCNIGIYFSPTAVGSRTAILRISTNDPARPSVDIAVSGEGTPPPPPPPPPTSSITSFADVTDLWGTTGEADWSLTITHHKVTTDALIAYWHTYDVDGRGMWLKLTDGHWVDGVTFTGNLHRSTGTAFSLPDDPNLFVDGVVGTATLTFTDISHGTLSYSLNGTTGSRTITRVTF
jgi:hypothetical protein